MEGFFFNILNCIILVLIIAEIISSRILTQEMMAYKIDMINEKEFEIAEDQTILQASLEAGIPHYHACGGNAQCSTCRVVVHEGIENLSS